MGILVVIFVTRIPSVFSKWNAFQTLNSVEIAPYSSNLGNNHEKFVKNPSGAPSGGPLTFNHVPSTNHIVDPVVSENRTELETTLRQPFGNWG